MVEQNSVFCNAAVRNFLIWQEVKTEVKQHAYPQLIELRIIIQSKFVF